MMVWMLIFFLVHSSVLQGDVEVGVNPGWWQVNEDQFSLDVSLHLPLLPLLFVLLLLHHVAQVLLMTWYPAIPHLTIYSTLKYAQLLYLAYLPVFGRIYALTYNSAHQIWLSGVSLKRPSKVQFRHIVDLYPKA